MSSFKGVLTGRIVVEDPRHEKWWDRWESAYTLWFFVPRACRVDLTVKTMKVLFGEEPPREVALELDFVFVSMLQSEAWGDTYANFRMSEVEAHTNMRIDGKATDEEGFAAVFGKEKVAGLIDELEANGIEAGEEEWLG